MFSETNNQASPLDGFNAESVVAHLRANLSTEVIGIYAFGSRVQGTANAHSDLDLAVLVAGYVDPLLLWRLAGELAELVGCAVDLLDLRAASTVMQYQVLTTGRRLWGVEPAAGLFECYVLSEKTALDTARSGLLADISQQGSVYGR
ncbi:type VII toxin-antitoxin system MntA family adenylyltransferase antitoxin [Deefgea salmonis]|uniref:Nucleotidyltransferase domain-containing protein n=1 Tax=Deefgea salmonis TaxID=2875502 RepID=A0ABS8BJ05_9NEIS|nr:nucleotidyltransferase domain-containing protein [Deefgea salmonis]MCB5195702.1 nucleotidyltransferase domain-containing protein [Deefgea salmonis]